MTGNAYEKRLVQFKSEGSLCWLTMNRADKKNSLSLELIAELQAALKKATEDETVKTIALTGSENVFCSGADLFSLQQNGIPPNPENDYLCNVSKFIDELRQCPKPTIAVVNGLACAGGLELILACDLSVALQNAEVGDAHANYAAFPGGGGAAVLCRRIGMNRAKYLLFTGKLIRANTLYEWGLFHSVEKNIATLNGTVRSLAANISRKSPIILEYMKDIVNATENESRDVGLERELQTLRKVMLHPDFEEGMNAFARRQVPRFEK